MIEKMVTSPIYYWVLPYILHADGPACGFAFIFVMNMFIAIPMIRLQDSSEDILGIEILKTACRNMRAEWSVRIGRVVANLIVLCILLDQTDPLFSFLVYRKDGEKGMGFGGLLRLVWYNILVTAWWTGIQTMVVRFVGMFFYWAFFKGLCAYYGCT